MFPKGLGNLGNLGGLLKTAMEMKGKVEEMRESLGNEVIEASAGGGMVTVTMNGRFEMLSIKIDREVVNPEDLEMLETLVLSAVNEGVRKAQDLVKAKMTEITGGMDIPGLM